MTNIIRLVILFGCSYFSFQLFSGHTIEYHDWVEVFVVGLSIGIILSNLLLLICFVSKEVALAAINETENFDINDFDSNFKPLNMITDMSILLLTFLLGWHILTAITIFFMIEAWYRVALIKNIIEN